MIAGDRLRDHLARRPLLTAVVYTGVGVLPMFLVSAQILQLGREIDFGVARLGFATACFFGMAALAANPAGQVVARLGPRQGLRIGSSLTVGACILAASASAWWVIPIATAVGGTGNGTIQIAANVAIFDGVSRRRQGLAFGSKQASVPMASMLAGVSLPVIGLVFGWRWVFIGAALLALMLAVSAPAPATRRRETRHEGPMGRPPPSLILLGLAGICGAMAGNGVSLFVVPSAVSVGISEAAAGAVLAVCSFLAMAVRLAAGWTVDRRGSSGHTEMTWLVGAGAVGALVLMATTSPLPYLVAMPVTVLGAWGWPGVFFFTVVHSHSDFPARASGMVLSSNLTGTVIGPLVVGILAGRGDYSSAWLFVGSAAVVSTVAFAFSRRLDERTARSALDLGQEQIGRSD